MTSPILPRSVVGLIASPVVNPINANLELENRENWTNTFLRTYRTAT